MKGVRQHLAAQTLEKVQVILFLRTRRRHHDDLRIAEGGVEAALTVAFQTIAENRDPKHLGRHRDIQSVLNGFGSLGVHRHTRHELRFGQGQTHA